MDQDVIKKIESGEIKMRPKSYFVWRSVLVIGSAVFVFLVSALIVGLVFFAMRESGATVLPGLGAAGWRELLNIFPWITIILAVLLTFALSVILRRYSFAYRKPLLYLPLAVIVLIFAAGYIVDASHLHRDISDFTEAHHTPGIEPFYRHLRDIGNDKIAIGEIQEISTSQIIINPPDNHKLTIILTSQTQMPDNLVIGDRIDVIGDRDDDTVSAIAIRRLLPAGVALPEHEHGFRPFGPDNY